MAKPETLPEGAECYRRIGPFDETSLPEGLRSEHRLKPGVWALLTVNHGALTFIWDDGRDDPVCELGAGDELVVPPEALHHVQSEQAFSVEIAFHHLIPAAF